MGRFCLCLMVMVAMAGCSVVRGASDFCDDSGITLTTLAAENSCLGLTTLEPCDPGGLVFASDVPVLLEGVGADERSAPAQLFVTGTGLELVTFISIRSDPSFGVPVELPVEFVAVNEEGTAAALETRVGIFKGLPLGEVVDLTLTLGDDCQERSLPLRMVALSELVVEGFEFIDIEAVLFSSIEVRSDVTIRDSKRDDSIAIELAASSTIDIMATITVGGGNSLLGDPADAGGCAGVSGDQTAPPQGEHCAASEGEWGAAYECVPGAAGFVDRAGGGGGGGGAAGPGLAGSEDPDSTDCEEALFPGRGAGGAASTSPDLVPLVGGGGGGLGVGLGPFGVCRSFGGNGGGALHVSALGAVDWDGGSLVARGGDAEDPLARYDGQCGTFEDSQVPGGGGGGGGAIIVSSPTIDGEPMFDVAGGLGRDGVGGGVNGIGGDGGDGGPGAWRIDTAANSFAGDNRGPYIEAPRLIRSATLDQIVSGRDRPYDLWVDGEYRGAALPVDGIVEASVTLGDPGIHAICVTIAQGGKPGPDELPSEAVHCRHVSYVP